MVANLGAPAPRLNSHYYWDGSFLPSATLEKFPQRHLSRCLHLLRLLNLARHHRQLGLSESGFMPWI